MKKKKESKKKEGKKKERKRNFSFEFFFCRFFIFNISRYSETSIKRPPSGLWKLAA